MSTIRILSSAEFADYAVGLVRSRSQWQSGDVIQPMLVSEQDGVVGCTRTTVRVLQRHDTGGLPHYTVVDKHGRIHDVWVSDDPRPGRLSDAEDE